MCPSVFYRVEILALSFGECSHIIHDHATWSSNEGFSNKTLVHVDPPCADSEIANADDIAGKVAVVVRGQCVFVDKAQRCRNAGAVGMLVINNDTQFPYCVCKMAGETAPSEGIDIPVILISLKNGALLEEGTDCSFCSVVGKAIYT